MSAERAWNMVERMGRGADTNIFSDILIHDANQQAPALPQTIEYSLKKKNTFC